MVFALVMIMGLQSSMDVVIGLRRCCSSKMSKGVAFGRMIEDGWMFQGWEQNGYKGCCWEGWFKVGLGIEGIGVLDLEVESC